MVLAPVGKDHVLRLLYDVNTHVGWHLTGNGSLVRNGRVAKRSLHNRVEVAGKNWLIWIGEPHCSAGPGCCIPRPGPRGVGSPSGAISNFRKWHDSCLRLDLTGSGPNEARHLAHANQKR